MNQRRSLIIKILEQMSNQREISFKVNNINYTCSYGITWNNFFNLDNSPRSNVSIATENYAFVDGSNNKFKIYCNTTQTFVHDLYENINTEENNNYSYTILNGPYAIVLDTYILYYPSSPMTWRELLVYNNPGYDIYEDEYLTDYESIYEIQLNNTTVSLDDNIQNENFYILNYLEDYVEPEEEEENDDGFLCFTAEEYTNISFVKQGSTSFTLPILYYKINDGNWYSYTIGNSITLLSGNKCYWKGSSNTFSYSSTNYINFTSSGKVKASGNIMTLLDQTSPALVANCFIYLFNNCTNLTRAPALPATALADYCYGYMFNKCTALTSAPVLPATTLAGQCYRGMFYGCTSLIAAPDLPATTLTTYCYHSMFSGCTSLNFVPNITITKLNTYSCRDMFYGCTSLTTISINFAVTTIPNYSCYTMYRGCSKLKLTATQPTSGTYIEFRIPTTGSATVSTKGLYNMFSNTGGSFTSTPTTSTTYYIITSV